ncbi:response regulator transcription factor [Acidovorax radicis]|jgi:DNA-binding response OmpR family regulator|uniref:response regulator transcription factor n=1 Tax=Acidovorax radicis TaxID=758826 RepID=UPI001CF94D4D|nr:response regulator transcription factor [Acidovorax radicis]UCV01346.1 response regulator transcription factor [Acidovorax radicis]
MRIAALDDDALQLDLFRQVTEAMGHVCHTYLTGAELLRNLRRQTYDLLIVDWHLPDTTGPEVVRWVRKNVEAQLPILYVTNRQEERDIVEGLGSGADDFMVKPVRIGELTARVSALLRRAYPVDTAVAQVFGRYQFLPETRSIEMDGVPVELKNREYELALFLFQNMGRLLSRDHLKEIVWGQVTDVMSRSLDTHISRLRMLLDLRPANGFVVTAIYGVGYRFEAVEAPHTD